MTDFAAPSARSATTTSRTFSSAGRRPTVHGSARLTLDVDVVYRRTSDNLTGLADALAPCEPRLRGAPPGHPFRWDADTLGRGLNFTLATSLGPIDLLGEIVGAGSYEQLLPDTTEVTGVRRQLPLRDPRGPDSPEAGRVRDLEAVAELEALREERGC